MSEVNSKKESKTPVIDNFCINVTEKAKNGNIDPIFGRKEELEKISIILSRRKKNNALLIGQPGVGKTAIPEALAINILNKDVPTTLLGKKIYSLDVSSIMAGTKYRGQLEERMKSFIDELEKNKDIILFIDEIHTIMGTGSNNGLDIANMLKPALARGTVQTIGATTLDEAKKYFEKDQAMDRRFGKIIIKPLSIEDTISALKVLKSKYEDHHGVTFPDNVIDKIPELASRYIKDRFLPDSAIDIMDEVGAKLQIQKSDSSKDILTSLEEKLVSLSEKKVQYIKQHRYLDIPELKNECDETENELLKETEKIKNNKIEASESDMRNVISSISKIPLDEMTENPKEKIERLKTAFNTRLSGQENAKNKVLKSLKRSFIGLSDTNKPMGSFLFCGKTAVGKTELAKIISNTIFDGSLVRVDMSEYMEKFNVSKMVGAPAGYVGHEDGGKLTEQVKRNPFSVVLFDEVEKAHPDVFNIFLQILDEGMLTDSHGNVVDFTNTIIIMTSNIGVKETAVKRVGFGSEKTRDKDNNDNLIKAVKSHFAPEIINRLSSVVVFDDLTKENISEILDIELNRISEMVSDKNVKIDFGKKLKEKILEDGYSEEYGARYLKRHVEEVVIDALTEYLLDNPDSDGSVLSLTYSKENDEILVKKKKNK